MSDTIPEGPIPTDSTGCVPGTKPSGYKVEFNSGIRQTVTPTEGGFQT